jgi:transposase
MDTTTPRVISVERVDDLPVLFAHLQRLEVAELLDRHFPSHHLWKGHLSFGEVVCVWLVFLASQGDHRLYNLLPWAEQRRLTLQSCLGKPFRALDFHDDRLADVLDRLALAEAWDAFETDLNGHTVRVYDLDASLFRIDATTASSSAQILSPEGLLQFGHSKDDPLRPQLKIAAAALDPLGLPVSIAVVAGNCADDPLYVPQIKKVQRSFGQGGKLYVGDCKMAALATRAYLADSGDSYLCPLSEKQLPRQDRLALLQPVWQGRQPLRSVYRPQADAQQQAELVAEGFCYDEVVQAPVDGRSLQWTERRFVVRSAGFAQAQQRKLDERLQKASEQIGRIKQRQHGRKPLDAQGMKEAALAILEQQRLEGLLDAEVVTTLTQRPVRRYKGRPAQVVQEEGHSIQLRRQEGAIGRTKEEMGWQVYATNEAGLDVEKVVWAYRGQYRIEDGWSRLKGKALSLSPLYLQKEGRMVGLVMLLSVAVRLLSLVEHQAREKLAQAGEALRGIYPGQAGRRCGRPSAELLLGAFEGISLAVVEVAGQPSRHVTPLTPLQQRLLVLWDLPPDLFHRITLHCADPPPA